MSDTPEPIQNLIDALSRLPGIGPKTASRLAFYLLNAPVDISIRLSEALSGLKDGIGFCSQCFNITIAGKDLCDICASSNRNSSQLCVVEKPMDVLVIEKAQAFQGKYHVLHGVLSPIEGIGPDDLKIRPLLDRLKNGGVREVILATNPSMEGDATALYLQKQITPLGIQVTRLARGLPVGGELEYTDQNTLLRAMAGRQEM